MRRHAQAFLTNPLISNSGILLIGSNVANVFQFLFNLFLSRSLSPAEFGIYSAIVSLITLPMYEAGAIVPAVVNFAASYFAKGELDKVRGLFFRVSQITVSIGLIFFILLLAFQREIGAFFKIQDSFLIFLAALCIFVVFIGIVNTPLLHAKLAFRFLTLSNFLSVLIKIGVGFVLVFLGFGVRGAIIGLTCSFVIPYLISFIPLKFLLERGVKTPKIPLKGLFAYGIPSALALLGLTSFITTDLLLVKHFFSPTEAGIYSGISLIARVLYFLSAPIGTVMFPLIIQQKTKGENYLKTFQLAFALVLLPSVLFTSVYFLFPDFVITFFLKKEEYLLGREILGLFAVFITCFSVLSVTSNFLLSIGKTIVCIPILVAAIVQIFLIWMFHASLYQVVFISLVTSAALFVIFVAMYISMYGKKT